MVAKPRNRREVMRDPGFDARNVEMIEAMRHDPSVLAASQSWVRATYAHEYSYHFEWMGLPIIQYPQDMVAVQELIWQTKPQVIVETGIARGGSLAFYASLLQLIGSGGRVIGIDIDIRPHNRAAIEAHPTFDHITLIEGSSIDQETVYLVVSDVGDAGPVMVVLDSNHTHDHVLAELQAYAPMVSKGCYLVVFDTIVEELPAEASDHRPWAPGDNPLTAVRAFMDTTDGFVADETVCGKLGITAARHGFLRREA